MRDLLTAGLTALDLDSAAADKLTRYAELLLEKNKVMNLTAITAPRDVATLHLLDCAALAAQLDLSGKRVIDVGTGAGFPGMVLASWDCRTCSAFTPGRRNSPRSTGSSSIWRPPVPWPS